MVSNIFNFKSSALCIWDPTNICFRGWLTHQPRSPNTSDATTYCDPKIATTCTSSFHMTQNTSTCYKIQHVLLIPIFNKAFVSIHHARTYYRGFMTYLPWCHWFPNETRSFFSKPGWNQWVLEGFNGIQWDLIGFNGMQWDVLFCHAWGRRDQREHDMYRSVDSLKPWQCGDSKNSKESRVKESRPAHFLTRSRTR